MATVLEFARKTAALGQALPEIERAAVAAAALEATTIIRREIREAVPSGALRMQGKKPKRVGARYKMLTGAKARISAEGPLHLVERDTSQHYIPRAAQKSLIRYRVNKRTGAVTVVRRQGKGRGRQGRTLNIPGVGFRKLVLHPGTKGRHPFEKGLTLARQSTGRVILAEVGKGVRAALR